MFIWYPQGSGLTHVTKTMMMQLKVFRHGLRSTLLHQCWTASQVEVRCFC